MIRDPSDGSVRAPRKPEESGLPPVQDPGSLKETERLNKLREWLQEYQQAVYDANRMNDKGEIT